jgi:serine/threonine protein kinase
VEAGRRIGKYVLDHRIAVGGMAEVWAAHAEGREGFVKPVALKFILESFSGDPELERLFVNEARIAARLQHANLVTVFDFDKVDAGGERGVAGRYYLAMERVEGQDLRRIFEAARRAGYVFPVGVALYVAGEVLKALRYVHDKREGGVALGLVHRDVSPHNVLVGFTGEVKLSDFGIAKAREHSARSTKPGSLRGKIAYASPEQLAGGLVDHRTDQFAAGVTIWEMFAGRKLFDGASDLEIIGKVARCEIPRLGDLEGRRDVPPAVEAVVRRMLAPEPGARYRTTAEALSAVLALPSYSPDGAPLGELVRALFTPSGAGLSQTVPLQRVDPARAAGAPTRTMDEGVPVASSAATKTPTRLAKRTSAALARSPAAAPPREAGSATTDVRARGRAAKVLGALAVGAAIAGAVTARRQLGFIPRLAGVAGDTPAASAPAATAAAPLVSPPAASPPWPERAASPAPAPAEAPSPPMASGPLAARPGTGSRSRRSARPAAVERHRSSRRQAQAGAAESPVITAPAPEAAAPSIKSSANGAPIIE